MTDTYANVQMKSGQTRAKNPCWNGIQFSQIDLASLFTDDKEGWDWHVEVYVVREPPQKSD